MNDPNALAPVAGSAPTAGAKKAADWLASIYPNINVESVARLIDISYEDTLKVEKAWAQLNVLRYGAIHDAAVTVLSAWGDGADYRHMSPAIAELRKHCEPDAGADAAQKERKTYE